MKLTKVQKEIIVMMQRGYKFQTSYGTPTLFQNGDNRMCKWDSVNILKDKGLIKTDTSDNEKCFFHLTELGKTIKL